MVPFSFISWGDKILILSPPFPPVAFQKNNSMELISQDSTSYTRTNPTAIVVCSHQQCNSPPPRPLLCPCLANQIDPDQQSSQAKPLPNENHHSHPHPTTTRPPPPIRRPYLHSQTRSHRARPRRSALCCLPTIPR